jgi:hypothetical protein
MAIAIAIVVACSMGYYYINRIFSVENLFKIFSEHIAPHGVAQGQAPPSKMGLRQNELRLNRHFGWLVSVYSFLGGTKFHRGNRL